MKTREPIANTDTAADRYGRAIAACLDASAEQLHHDITERLRVARQQALALHRRQQQTQSSPAPAVQLLGVGTAALGAGPAPGEGGSWWQRLVALLPLAALIAGLVAIQMLSTDDLARELAEIDEAILTDDLPPDAYTDPGFAQFLKNRLLQLNQD